jgi:hypothetical protein
MFSLRQFLFFILLLSTFRVVAQPITSWREKTIVPKGDTIILDTLSIVPGTFSISQNNVPLDSSQFILNAPEAKIILKHATPHANLQVKYAVYPFLFTQEHYHKNQKTFTTSPDHAVDPFLYRPEEAKTEDPFATGGLTKSGSLSRGISFGNTRDVSVNSSLNLQLSGKLTDNIDLMMVATDDNLPIQADGTTQQLQEFDRVYIQLSGNGTKLIAGDFFLTRPNSYFMNFNKKAQGLTVASIIPMDTVKKTSLMVTGSAAISKGKFARNVLQGVEGNQGPYRLRGAENELFIVVLSGTEKVYVDGKLLVRGQENDYTINYNTAEIIFTAKQLITKDRRIVVEFQYSDRNYSRSLFHAGVEYKTENYSLRFNAYSEQDSKNQPLQQTLTTADKITMRNVGDTLNHALVSGVDSGAFAGDRVQYKRIDTTVSLVTYQNVYVYSTSSDSAFFSLTFTYVGPAKGNYVQYTSSANGKTFKWVAPVGNIPQGDYEPVILLITPKKKQLVTFGGDFKLYKNTTISAEAGYSTNDLNTFSPYDAFDDHGYGAHLDIKNKHKIADSLTMTVEGNYEYVSRYFSPLERYRPVEFERDWNLGWGSAPRTLTADQHIGKAGISFEKTHWGNIGYDFSTFIEGTAYNGFKHSANASINHKGFTLTGKASFLNSSGIYGATDFLRQRVAVSQKIFKQLTLSGYEDQEINNIHKPNSDTLQSASLGYFEWQAAMTVADTTKRSFTVFYKQRTDRLPSATNLQKAAYAEDFGGTIALNGNPNQQLKLTVSYRLLNITQPLLTTQKPDNTLVGRVEYNARAWKGLLTASTFYEAGSGLEVKKEFTYIEVPAGQGNYSWTDYNNNGVQELNEFEIAVYSDQAKFIRVFIPTNEYIKVYTNQFSQSVNLRPSVKWANNKGFLGFIARFSDQAAYRVDRKTQSSDPAHAFLPQLDDARDTELVSLNATVRNTIAFNQLSSKFGLEYTWQDLRGKSLLTNGLESRRNAYNDYSVRWNITKALSLTSHYRDGVKTNTSEFFSSRNYRIKYSEIEPKFSIQPGTTFRVSFSYRYSQKQNAPDLGNESALVQKFGTEIKLSKLSKGSFTAEVNYVEIKYTGLENSAVGYDMLEGLRAGKNFTWQVNWQRSLADNLQLTLGYEGRKTPGVGVVHTGTAQVRAIF